MDRQEWHVMAIPKSKDAEGENEEKPSLIFQAKGREIGTRKSPQPRDKRAGKELVNPMMSWGHLFYIKHVFYAREEQVHRDQGALQRWALGH